MAGGVVTRGRSIHRAQAQAQPQAQKVREVSKIDSLELIRCLLKVSVNEICFLRGLFPDECFTSVNLQHLEGMHLQTLKSTDPQAKRVMMWLDGGIQDAIQKMYLKTMMFGMASNSDGTRLLEEYAFSFSYNTEGHVALQLTGGQKGSPTTPFKSADMESIRFQVCRLIRTLVQICRTLEKVPEDRYIFMKLTYYDSTPPEYEPPYFRADDNQASFVRRPFHMHVGDVATAHHVVGLKVKSILDSVEYGDEDEPMPSEGHSSCLPASETCNSAGKATSRYQKNKSDEPQQTQCSPIAGLQANSPIAPALHAAAPSDTTCDPEADKQYARIKEYCTQRKQVDLTDAMAHFPDMDIPDLKRYFDRLVIDQVLSQQTKGRRDTFKVCQSSIEMVSPAEIVGTSDLQGTGLGKSSEEGGQGALAQATKAMQALRASDANGRDLPRHSSGAMCRGSEHTCSKPDKENRMAEMFVGSPVATNLEDSQAEQPLPGLFLDSQQSGQKKRKASMVDELISQHKRSNAGSKPAPSRAGRLSNMSN